MDIKAFPALIVGVVVALVLAGAVLPVFAETTSATDTFTNDGIIRMSKVDDSFNSTIEWDHTKPSVVSINGVDKTMPQDLTIALTIGGTDDYFIRYASTSVTVFHDSAVVNASVADETDMTITISAGTITSTNGSYTDTFTYTDDLFLISDDGKYIMKNMADKVYVKSDSDIHAYGRTYLGDGINTQCNFNINGNLDDGFTIEPWGTNTTLTVSNEIVTDEKVNGYIGLYKFTNVSFTVSDTSEHSTTATYGQVIVPYEVTAEKTAHPDGPLSVMLNVLPLLAIAGLVTGAVVWFINRKG